jgi:hypothetical protein
MRRKEKRKRKFNAVVNLTVTMPTTGKEKKNCRAYTIKTVFVH